MLTAQVALTILKEFKTKKFFQWLLILAVSATGPLLGTYIFSRGVNALELGYALKTTLFIFFVYFLVWVAEIALRVGAKTRIHIHVEQAIVNLQQQFVTTVPIKDSKRPEVIQASRNLSDAIQNFTTNFINNGVAGLVSLFSVPALLFFIDRRIFLLEITLMFVYLVGTFVFGKKYEKQYENLDAAKEKYFSQMSKSNKLRQISNKLVWEMRKLQDWRFTEWVTLQNMVAVTQLLVIFVLAVDILNGLKGISDLVLVIGYTNESRKFLNSVTGIIEGFMQIVAGVDRLVITTHGAAPGSITKIS